MKLFRSIVSLSAVLLLSGLAVPLEGSAAKARTIEMDGTDSLKFTVTTIQAKPGEPLRVVLTTISKMPKEVMAHNFVLLTKDANVQAFINASAIARKTEYIAPGMKDQVLAATGMGGGGEIVEVTFNAPKEPGKYIYVCTFPGHYAGGMWGTLIVK
jgi:azurin